MLPNEGRLKQGTITENDQESSYHDLKLGCESKVLNNARTSIIQLMTLIPGGFVAKLHGVQIAKLSHHLLCTAKV